VSSIVGFISLLFRVFPFFFLERYSTFLFSSSAQMRNISFAFVFDVLLFVERTSDPLTSQARLSLFIFFVRSFPP